MTTNNILEKMAFNTLDNAGQKAIRRLFSNQYLKGKKPDWNTLELFRQRQSLASTVSFYDNRLGDLIPATYQFLSEHQKKAVEQELLFMFYVFSAQYQLDEAEHRRQGLQEQSVRIFECVTLLKQLREDKSKTPAAMLARAAADSEKHLKYLGLTIVGPFMVEKMLQLSSGKTTTIKEWMGEVNSRRLYWVWGGGMLASVIGMLSDDFLNKPQAQQALAVPSTLSGYMSWMLYYTRFAINLGLLLKHTIAGSWMSAEEKAVPAWERFQTQWQQRKFDLLNDSIWATANMVCFFWLTGSGMPGYWGNVLTAGLLILDISLTIWRMCEESTQHNKEMLRLTGEIADLRAKIAATPLDIDEDREILQQQLAVLQKGRDKCEFDWTYKKYKQINDLVYAISLLAAFSVVCCMFFPPAAIAPATAMLLGVIGAALCFTLNVAYAAVSGALDIAKERAVGKLAKHEKTQLLAQFNQNPDELQKKQWYLDIKKLEASSDYQQRVVDYQKMQLVKSVLISLLVPPLVFVSFMFMPLGIGLAVVSAGLALALMANIILSRFEPEADKMPAFNENEYRNFERRVGNARLGFFPPAVRDGAEQGAGDDLVLGANPAGS